MKLYHSARSSASYRVRIALALKGIAYESRLLDMQAMQHRSDEYRRVNPLALVPALETNDGVLTQSLAIIEYLDETLSGPRLLPRDAADRAYVRAVSQLIACEIHPLNNLRALEYVRTMTGNPDTGGWYAHWIRDGFTLLEDFLRAGRRHGTYCLGEEPTMADCCLVPQVANAERLKCDLSPFPTVMRIRDACARLPAFIEAEPEHQGQKLWMSK